MAAYETIAEFVKDWDFYSIQYDARQDAFVGGGQFTSLFLCLVIDFLCVLPVRSLRRRVDCDSGWYQAEASLRRCVPPISGRPKIYAK